MKHRKLEQGFTLAELSVVCLATVMVAAMVLSGLVSMGRHSQRDDCVNNLKQVGLAFRVWEGDNSDNYPMAVSTANGGAEENVWSLLTSGAATPTEYGVTNVFLCMSNELSTPKLLACPADAGRSALSYWTNATFQYNVSYFVCGDAADDYPQMILTGDRNVGPSQPTGVSTGPAIITNVSSSYINATSMAWNKTAWTATDLHQKAGNIGLADGSVQQVTISGLQAALHNATNGVTALSGGIYSPPYNFPN